MSFRSVHLGMVVPCLDVAQSWRIPWAPPPVWLAGTMALITALFALTQDARESVVSQPTIEPLIRPRHGLSGLAAVEPLDPSK